MILRIVNRLLPLVEFLQVMNNNRWYRILLIVGQLFFIAPAMAMRQERLYINEGELTGVDRNTFPFWAFNTSCTFSATNARLKLHVGDTLQLTVINNSSRSHAFAILNFALPSISIAPKDSATSTYIFDTEKLHILYDPTQAPINRYMGLATMITVEKCNLKKKSFYWNLKEHHSKFNVALANKRTVDWKKYYPDYFTINSRSYPETQYDPTAKVVANVGDTVLLHIANTGQAKHILHFHGFHLKVIHSSQNNLPKDAIKDTFPLASMQTVVLQMIADKRGQYSVHNQNLLAMSGRGIYPYGMLIIMQINE